jgi:hypothetical protein
VALKLLRNGQRKLLVYASNHNRKYRIFKGLIMWKKKEEEEEERKKRKEKKSKQRSCTLKISYRYIRPIVDLLVSVLLF